MAEELHPDLITRQQDLDHRVALRAVELRHERRSSVLRWTGWATPILGATALLVLLVTNCTQRRTALVDQCVESGQGNTFECTCLHSLENRNASYCNFNPAATRMPSEAAR